MQESSKFIEKQENNDGAELSGAIGVCIIELLLVQWKGRLGNEPPFSILQALTTGLSSSVVFAAKVIENRFRTPLG